MLFRSDTPSKYDYACYAAASLAHLAQSQRDRVGLATFDTSIRDFLPPGGTGLAALLHQLETTQPAGPGALEPAVRELMSRLRRRSIIVVLSDFYEPADRAARALGEARARGHDVVAVHILHAIEKGLQVGDTSVLEDMETSEQLALIADDVRPAYQAALDQHCEELANACRSRRVDYVACDTSMPLANILHRYLLERAASKRLR